MPSASSPRARRVLPLLLGTAATLAILCSLAASAAFGHAGHAHDSYVTFGPPAPDWVEGAAEARDANGQAMFQRDLAEAPLEVDGACEDTASFDGIGRGCRTDSGLLRVELPGGGDMLTHGPDFVGAASDLTPSTTTPSIVAAVQNATKSDVSCVPTTQAHTQLIYAIPADGVDRSASKAAPFRQSTYEASAVIDNTSRMLSSTAGRRLRVACDGSNEATVMTMRLPRRAAVSTFGTVRSDVEAEYAKTSGVGNATKVRYLVYYDAHLDGFAGIGSLFDDTSPGATNSNNRAEGMALQDNSSGNGPNWFVLLHEISHNMGAVQDGAPDSNQVSHCNDGRDVMCYAEPGTAGVTGTYTETTCVELQYDCDHDSYFHPAPTTPWLQSNWNVASTNNRYLDAYAAAADTTAPATPTGFAGVGHGTFIRLTWNAVADADLHTYRIERDTTGGGAWRTVGDAWLGETTFDATWSGIAASTSYSLRVSAYDERGNLSTSSTPISVNSGVSDAQTLTVGGPALAGPTNAVVASSTTGSITFQWDAPQTSGATGWEVYKEYGADWWRSQWSSGSAAGSVTFSTDVYGVPLEPNTRYQYQIRLTDGWGRVSAPVTIAGWTKIAPDVTAPSAPGSLVVASSAGTSPTLTWATVGDAVDYVVSLETFPGSGSWTQQAIVTSPTHVLTGLAHATTHSIGVQARDEAGNVSARSTVSFAAPAAPSIQAPTSPNIDNMTFDWDYTTITYSWAASTDDGTVSYRMLYAPSASPIEWLAGPAGPGLSGTITGLKPGTQYRVTVEATDTDGHSTIYGGGSYFNITTDPDTTAPTQPPTLTATLNTETSMQLDWGISTDVGGSGVVGYRVYRTSPGPTTLLTTTAPGTRTYTPTGLTTNTSYTFEVEAYDHGDNVSTRRSVTSSTLPPSDLVRPSTPATFTQGPGALTETTAPVQWTAATDNVAVTGYDIYRTAPTASGTPVASVGAVTSTTITGLTRATAYTFEIAARDAAGNVSLVRQPLSFTTPDQTAPSTPGNLRASGTTATGTTLDWDASVDNVGVVGYRVERVLPTTGVLTTTTGLSYGVTGLSQATSYRFRVFARDAAGNEASSTIDVATPDVTDPTSPTSFTAGTLTETSAPVSWSGAGDNVAVTGYRIYRTAPTASGTPVATVGAETSTTLASLAPAVAYTFEIEAVDAAGRVSSPRRSLSFTTPDLTAPSWPGDLEASATSTSGTHLEWDAATDNVGVVNYRVRRVSPASGDITTTTGLSYDVSGLSDVTEYQFQIIAVDAAGRETASNTVAVTTLDGTAPTQPGVISPGTATSSTIPLSWIAATDNVLVTGYRIYLGPDTSGTLLYSPAGTSQTILGLQPMTSYTFTIVAHDALGLTSSSRTITTSTSDSVAPTVPANLRTTGRTPTSITLAWDASTDDVLTTGYRLYQVVGGIDTLVPGVTGTTHTVSGLSDGTDYSFKVSAIDAIPNASALSGAHATYTSDTQAPTQPGALQVGTVTGSSIALSWTASTDSRSPITYELRDGSAGGALLTPATTTLGATITGLDDAVTYHVYLVARDPSDNVSASRNVSVRTTDTTDPTAPTSLLASNVAGTSFDLSWTAATDNDVVDHYRVLVDGSELASPTSTAVGITGRAEATTYDVDVIAVDAAGRQSPTASIEVTTLDATAPSEPDDFVASSASDTSVSLSWTLSTDNVAVDGYRIYRMSPGAPNTLVASPTAAATSATISGLAPNTAYTFDIVALDAAGNLSSRASVTRTTLATPDTTPPTAPTFLLPANVTTGGMRLAWTASTDLGGIAGYELERLDSATWTLIAPRTSLLQFDVTGLAAGTSHSFRIRVFDAAGNATTSATLVVATNAGPDTTAPTVPAGPVISSADDTGVVHLGWGASTDDRGTISGYRVSRLTAAGYILQSIEDSTSATLTGQPIGTTATYAIAAVDPAGNTSAPLVATVGIPAPPAPPTPPAPVATPVSALSATSTSTSITLTWQQSGTTTTGWRVVEFRGGATASTREVTTPSATFGPYAPNTSVRFEVYALMGATVSAAVSIDARTAADTAKPSKPGKFKATSTAKGTLSLTWTKSTDDIALKGYEVKLTTKGQKAKVVKLPASAVKTKVVKLRARAAYVVQIRALDTAGNASAWVTAKVRTK